MRRTRRTGYNPGMSQPLSDAAKEHFRHWVLNQARVGECPCCHHKQWSLANHYLIDNMVAGNGVTILSDEAVLYYAMFCANCGYTMRFNAAIVERAFGRAVNAGAAMPASSVASTMVNDPKVFTVRDVAGLKRVKEAEANRRSSAPGPESEGGNQ